MRIVILGAGKIGSYVASTLSREEHDVVLIDKDEKALQNAQRESDLATFQAGSMHCRLLETLAERPVDLFFAATGDDAANQVSCSIAKNLGFSKTVCRVRERDYLHHHLLDFKRLFSIDYFIGPEILAAQDLCKMLLHGADLAVEHFAHGAVQMRTIEIKENWNRKEIPIANLGLPSDLIVALIRRKVGNEEKVLIPHGQDSISPLDQVTLVGGVKRMHQIHEFFGSQSTQTRSVILVGGSPIAFHLAYDLIARKIDVRIIEKDLVCCEMLAKRLPSATILHRDGLDFQLLRSERVDQADALIACTHSDETNLLIAASAKELFCPKAIAEITNSEIVPILEKLKILPALSPRVHVANRILSILDEETTLSVASISCDAAKIVELKISPSSHVVGIPLSQLGLPKGILIAMIERQGKIEIGQGNTVLCPEDIVIAVCDPMQLPKLQQLFH